MKSTVIFAVLILAKTAFGNEPPDISILFPEEGSIVETAKPVIAVSIFDPDGDIDIRTIRVYLDGKDITIMAKNSEELVSYTPLTDLADGIHRVMVVAADLKGNVTVPKNWSFTIKAVEPPLIRLQGTTTTEFQYADVIRYPQYESYLPYRTGWKGWTSQFTVSASGEMFGKFMNIYSYVISQNPTYQQTLQRFRMQVNDELMNIGGGDLFPNYSEFTFYGSQRMRGGEFGMNLGTEFPAKIKLMAFGGQTKNNVDGSSSLSGTYSQYLGGGRVIWKIDEGWGVNSTYIYGRDDTRSITTSGSTKPIANDLINTEGFLSFPWASTKIQGEISFSRYNTNISDSTIDIDRSRAWKIKTTTDLGNHTFSLTYRDVRPNFYSMGNQYLTSDQRGVELTENSRLFNNFMFTSFSGYRYWDNSEQSKSTTTTTTSSNFYVSLIPQGLPSINMGVGFQARKTSEEDPTTNNYTLSYNFGLNGRADFDKDWYLTAYGSYLLLQYRDFGVYRANHFNSISAIVGWIWNLGSLGLNNGFGYNENIDMGTGTITKYIISTNKISYKLFSDTFVPYIGYNVLAGLNTSDTSNTRKDSSIGGLTVNFSSTNTLVISFEHIEYKDLRTAANSYIENIAIIKHTMTF